MGERDYYRLLPHLRLRLGWEQFGAIVKHSQRYFFADHVPEGDGDDPDYVTPGEMLSEIGNAIRDAGLLGTLPADFPVFRVRADKNGETYSTAGEIGTAPLEYLTSSGRMAPAGIPLFDGAFDDETALVESRSANPDANAFSVGHFLLREPLLVVDLTQPPESLASSMTV